MQYQLYKLPEEFEVERLKGLPSTLGEDEEGVCIRDIFSLGPLESFLAIVQQGYTPPVDRIALALDIRENHESSYRKTYIAGAISEDKRWLILCTHRSALRASNLLVREIETSHQPEILISAFQPEDDIITVLCEKLGGSGMNLEKGEWIFRGKRGGHESVRIAGQTIQDILSESEVYELLGLWTRPMVLGVVRVEFPNVPGDVVWRLWRTRSHLAYSIALQNRKASLSTYLEVGLRAARILIEADVTGLVRQEVLESFHAATMEA